MRYLFSILLFVSAFSLSAQRFEILEGKLKNVKGITAYNVVFDYEGQKIQGFETEEAFLQDKMKKRENKEGKAEKFREDWYGDRTKYYEPAFVNYFNKRFEKGEIKVGKDIGAAYTMKIKTTWIYPGYAVGVAAEPAKISAVVTIFETANPSNVVVSIAFDKSIGIEQGQFDFSQGERIAGAYEKLAKNLAMQFKRFL